MIELTANHTLQRTRHGVVVQSSRPVGRVVELGSLDHLHVVEEHRSPDGLLKLVVWRDPDGDITVGFDGFSWHTHADILAGMSGLPEDAALREFVDDTLGGRSIIAVSRVGDTIRDVWVTDTAEADKYKPEDEKIEFRYWNGSLVV